MDKKIEMMKIIVSDEFNLLKEKGQSVDDYEMEKLKYSKELKGYVSTKEDPINSIKEYKYNTEGKLVKVKETKWVTVQYVKIKKGSYLISIV